MTNIAATYTIEDVSRMLLKISEKIMFNVDTLAELDGLSGDGDLGETMEKSANAVIQTVEANPDATDIGALLLKVALAMNKAAPSTLGTLLSCAVMACAKELKGRQSLCAVEVAHIPGIMAAAIQEKGKAARGDKTILDALLPMSEAVIETFGASISDSREHDALKLKTAFHKGALAAKAGAENTATMIPKAGRAQWIGERVRENLDAGAVLCAIVGELFLFEE